MGLVDEAAGGEAVREAIRTGQSFIDTAEMYELASSTQERLTSTGQVGSETVIGRALLGHEELQRDTFYATKASVQPYTRENIRAAAQRSLINLQTDTMDLYQLHGVDVETPIAEQMGALQELQNAGIIRYIGLNNANVQQLEAAWATGVRFHTLQIRYNMFSRAEVEAELVPWCREHGVGILAHSVLGKGLLTGRYKPGHTFPHDDERAAPGRGDFQGERFELFCAATAKLSEVAARKGATMTELAVGWVLRLPEVAVALVGAKSAEQVVANNTFVQEFTEAELREIDGILAEAPSQ